MIVTASEPARASAYPRIEARTRLSQVKRHPGYRTRDAHNNWRLYRRKTTRAIASLALLSEKMWLLLEGVLDLLAGISQAGFCLVELALAPEALISGCPTNRLFGLAAQVVDFVAYFVFGSHASRLLLARRHRRSAASLEYPAVHGLQTVALLELLAAGLIAADACRAAVYA